MTLTSQERALRALDRLGGRATAREIAFRADLAPHEVAGVLRHTRSAIHTPSRAWLALPSDETVLLVAVPAREPEPETA